MTTETKHKVLVLLGPTAVGKTRLSLELAEAYNAEIISGDSMQVYRGMDIGTAKISTAEMNGIPHHLIDIHDPEEAYSVAEFQEQGKRLIAEISGRGRLPFIVGGTGLYIESLCYGFRFSEAVADEAFRAEQDAYAETHGAEALHARLAAVDPASAERLHPNDRRRIIRALEIHHQMGTTLSANKAEQTRESPYELCLIGLTMDRKILYRRIEDRIDQMLEQGLIAEVQGLLDKGYHRSMVAMQGLGYKEIAAYLKGELTYEEAVTLLKRDTRRFAKRQLSWFRHMKEIEWIEDFNEQNYPANLAKIREIISRKLDR
ncbi:MULTISPECIES: tRNA (adenosine(37)-N6)-dimethylallyltransferase MiaA [unclassified Paenibacillus]|uniref:tRNA (adenosine(37)-N6)-dimethylallyltransferase MiaA n=1 Tax=unclassified Paenibacillus TaxID=185978 RepID=UPI002406BEEA|nr:MULTISPECIES: tRNA (adenosine(37)-N6)-dimethylallyltransferase MiaA [unclassified Paenibacillus]MDF9841041.1 tRNA dimethylallyltransferase [Paenibacillus sp. PastF-2]MDF9847786.1 tRNA dimethylallyltransferase [Paenibacillus sp. PastM-2]MDF9854355.1 tRNA dimethylallyltransferase [Paenibacillus sp. PastF-1]MDH6479474.1 tRNA dimethylallyltransferase [Paenibacillus sp. PastH-2]MDH6505140.1 tRNA dimethylallyltransferase [Paenibacillus sp. PastM-3]